MLGKVLKYDIKAIGRYLIPLYAVLLGLGIMIRILDFFEKVSVINIILGFMIAAFILLITFSFVLNGIFVIKLYLENLFKDEAYLTHTLPVKKNTLLISKVLTAMITLFLTFVVMMISLIIAFYYQGLMKDVIHILSQSFGGMEIYKVILYMAGYGLISYLTTILMVFAAIAIGYSKSSNKLGYSVIWAIIFYFGIEFLYLGLLGIVMSTNSSFITSLETNIFMMSDLLNFFTIFMIFTVLLGLGFYFISYKFINKRLNLE